MTRKAVALCDTPHPRTRIFLDLASGMLTMKVPIIFHTAVNTEVGHHRALWRRLHRRAGVLTLTCLEVGIPVEGVGGLVVLAVGVICERHRTSWVYETGGLPLRACRGPFATTHIDHPSRLAAHNTTDPHRGEAS